MTPTFGSLFAGVGGFDLGMEAAGWDCRWQVEWDKHCQAVLARHWPEVPRWSDIRDASGATMPPVDCITFGSPCQDLSVAGKRAGLDGERSGLFHEAIRIIKEMRDATDARYPRWAIWENVAGALSSNKGDDFGTVLDTLADAGALVIEWAVLDARWFGVPQRRRRVFVIACFDPAIARQCPDPLLPVAARSGWHPPAGDTARQEVAVTLAGGTSGCGPRNDTDRMTFVPVTVGTLTAGAHPGGFNGQDAYNDQLIAQPVLAFDSTLSNGAVSVDVSPTVKVGTGLEIASPPAVLVPSLTASNDPSRSPQSSECTQQIAAVHAATAAVRRLTPLECERLMGWPDDHTRWRADDTEQSDSARYRQCGNGVASPVAAWIGRHLLRAMECE